MRYGIFSDIHGNFEALFAVIESLKKEDIGCYLCVGDIVGYGANPNECVEFVRERKIDSIVGNHDFASIQQMDISFFNPIAKEALLWTAQQLKQQNQEYIKKLPVLYQNEDLMLVHGCLPFPEKFQYLRNWTTAKEMFPYFHQNVCFVGHTHMPGYFHKKQTLDKSEALGTIVLSKTDQYIINVGSVGQPRDGDSRAAYCVYDSEAKSISLKRIVYPVEQAQKKILAARLPSSLASRLSLGM